MEDHTKGHVRATVTLGTWAFRASLVDSERYGDTTVDDLAGLNCRRYEA